jgi:hypothetical protein
MKKKTGQGCDKKMYPKLVVNKLKVMGNSTFIYIDGHLAQGNFPRNFQPTCGPCSPMCVHEHPCVPMCTLVKLMFTCEL